MNLLTRLLRLVASKPPEFNPSGRSEGSGAACRVVVHEYGGPNDGVASVFEVQDLELVTVDDENTRRLNSGPVLILQFDQNKGQKPTFHLRVRVYPGNQNL